jgi:UDP-N-acetylmuramate dehydrogenase
MQVLLAPMTTLRLGGPAKHFVRAHSEEEIVGAASSERLFVLGAGSNVVIADEGWDGTVLKIASRGVRGDGGIFEVEAGEVWDDLVRQWTDDGYAGVECLAGIPGLAGSVPMQNVGAYGQEVQSTIVRVRAFDRKTNAMVELSNGDCCFGYRSSIFRGSDRWIITRVTFRLHRSDRSMPIRYAELARALGVKEGDRAPLDVVRDTVIALRKSKGMVLDPTDPDTVSAGSFFTNPILSVDEARAVIARAKAMCGAEPPSFPVQGGKVKLAAAWLIERAGFSKGFAIGRARISRKHALALVSDGATTAELLELARAIRKGVKAAFGVTLEPEPIFVGCRL